MPRSDSKWSMKLSLHWRRSSRGLPRSFFISERSQVEQRDRAARALFSATEIVNPNKFETQFGGDVPMAKYGEYARRYQTRFQKQANQLAKDLSQACAENPKLGDPTRIYAKLAHTGGTEFRDAWGTSLTFEPARWDSTKTYYVLRSAGPDRQLNTGDDLQAFLLFQRKWVVGSPGSKPTAINVNIEHDRGPFNGLAEIVGTITDPTGAVVPGASVEARHISTGKTRIARTNANGQFSLSGVPAGDYVVQVSMAGFKIAEQKLTLQPRDRAVLSATLSVGASSQVVEVTSASPGVRSGRRRHSEVPPAGQVSNPCADI